MLAIVNELQSLDSEHIAGDDIEGGDSQMTTGEEGSKAIKSSEMVVTIPTPSILKYVHALVGIPGMSP